MLELSGVNEQYLPYYYGLLIGHCQMTFTFQVSNLIQQQLNAPSCSQDSVPTSKPMAPPAYQPTAQAAPAVGAAAPTVAQGDQGTSGGASAYQLFTTNIVKLVGKVRC